MKNADIIKKITDYIQGVATERGLTHRDIANLCSQKGGKCCPDNHHKDV